MAPWERALFLAANAVLNDLAEAEEVAQSTVLEALSTIHELRGGLKFGTWLVRIAIHGAKERNTKGDKHSEDSLPEQRADDEEDYVPKDLTSWREIRSEALQNKEVCYALQCAFASLPQECREVFMLEDVAHLSHDEAALALGLTLRNVKARLQRVRLQMRDALAPGIDGGWSVSKSQYHRAGAW